ncbi:MAG: hypothetical protein ACO3GK_05635 [Bacteroidia bacterium]
MSGERPNRETVLHLLQDTLSLKWQEAVAALQTMRESRDAEEKSSAGDKYETGRAMAQIEMEKLSQQMQSYEQQKERLNLWVNRPLSQQAQLGHLLEFKDGPSVFLGPALGLVKSPEAEFLAVSADSPLGRTLMGMALGEKRLFNGRAYTLTRLL